MSYRTIVVRADLLLPNLPKAHNVMGTVLTKLGESPKLLPQRQNYTSRLVHNAIKDPVKADIIWGIYWTLLRSQTRILNTSHPRANSLFQYTKGSSLVCYHPEKVIQDVLKEKMWEIKRSNFTNYITSFDELSPADDNTLLITNDVSDCYKATKKTHMTVQFRENLD